MRIGEFAEKHGVTIDTVRHYMDEQLLMPEKSGGQYEFGDACCKDLEEILWLKKAGFTLAEIKKALSIERLGKLSSSYDRQCYIKLLQGKKGDLAEEIVEREESIKKIEGRMAEFKTDMGTGSNKIGVPLEFASLLACPQCGKSMVINGAIINSMIIDGQITCRCGFALSIVNGIITNAPEEVKSKAYYFSDADSYEEYIAKTSIKFINYVHRSVEWIIAKLRLDLVKQPTILELGTGWGSLLKHAYGMFTEDVLYIATDNDIEALTLTKWILEKEASRTKFVFIHGNIEDIPLKKETVDLVLDFWGTSCHNFKKPGYLINYIKDRLKPGGRWLAGHLYFKEDSSSLKRLAKECRLYLYLDNIIGSYQNNGFTLLDSKDMGYIDEGGEYEPFLVKGDKAFEWVYYGIKYK
ncbi:MAG TPA: MerR family transcriptional regulator [Bacillota bacterium]